MQMLHRVMLLLTSRPCCLFLPRLSLVVVVTCSVIDGGTAVAGAAAICSVDTSRITAAGSCVSQASSVIAARCADVGFPVRYFTFCSC